MRVPQLLALLGLATAASAGDITWESIGPGGGGWIQSICADPRDAERVHVGCDVGGYYRSDDAGRRFRITNEGLTDQFIECLVVDPTNPNIIYAGCQGGVHKSTDGGRTWQRTCEGLPPPQRYSYGAPIGGLAIDPTNPKMLYAGIGRPRQQEVGRGHVYRSDDGAETWRLLTEADPLGGDAIISDIEISPADSSLLLVASNKGLFRSADGGATWTEITAGLPHKFVHELAIAPSDPQTVYCTVRAPHGEQPWDGGVYKSTDGGLTWAPKLEGLRKIVGDKTKPRPMTSDYKEIVVDPTDPDRAYVGGNAWVTPGVYRTIDGGDHWEWCAIHHGDDLNMDRGWITQWGPTVKCLTISPVAPRRLYFGTSGHVFRTDDGGGTWVQCYTEEVAPGRWRGNGLEVTCLFDLVVDPQDPARLYCCYYDIGLLISDDRGDSFRRSVNGMKNHGNCFTVVIDPADSQRLWATTGQWGSNRGDVCFSADRGETWEVVGRPETGLPDGQTKWLINDPKSPPDQRALYVGVNAHGVFRSADSGRSWTKIGGDIAPAPEPSVRGLARDADTGRLWLALGATKADPRGGVYLLEGDDGPWQKVSGEQHLPNITSLTRDEQSGALYVTQRELYNRLFDPPRATPGGLFRSADDGHTWEQIHEHHFPSCLAIGPTPGVLYLGMTDHPYHDNCRGDGVLKSTDGGRTWRQENAGLTDLNISCLTLDPTDPSRLYLGTGGNGLFRGTDN